MFRSLRARAMILRRRYPPIERPMSAIKTQRSLALAAGLLGAILPGAARHSPSAAGRKSSGDAKRAGARDGMTAAFYHLSNPSIA